MELFMVKETKEIINEINISKIIITNIPNYMYFFYPIIKHTTTQNTTKNTTKTLILSKEPRTLIDLLPITHKPQIYQYLLETIKILLEHNINIPITNDIICYDTINHIPLLKDFKKAIIITKWQNKEIIKEQMITDVSKLIYKHYIW